MSLSRYFLHDFFTARELNQLEERERRRRHQQRRWLGLGERHPSDPPQ